MLVMAAGDATLDPDAVWEALPPRGEAHGRAADPHAPPLACDMCHCVSFGQTHCPRCGAALHRRKPHSLSRTCALVLAAAILYLPANLLPVLTFVRLGRGEPSTIIEGVRQLAAAQMWPLALLVFFASITVPVLKILGLTLMLVTTWRGSAWRLVERTRLYRIVDFIGRWSMIDVFMISILTALVRLGLLASVYPGPGVLAFCAVVLLTMVAAACFDPRLMWDAAGRNDDAAGSAP
jgi:paraquat-inducible protein A